MDFPILHFIYLFLKFRPQNLVGRQGKNVTGGGSGE